MLKAKLKDYIKGEVQGIKLPWKLGGLAAWPQEQKFDPFIAYNRLLNEEKVTEKIHQLAKSFASNQISEYQSILEYSLARHIRNEMTRLHHQKYKFELQVKEIYEINLFNVINVFRVGVVSSRHANRQEKIAKFPMKIDDKDFQTFFNKRPKPNDKAVISMWFDVAFEAHVQTLVSGPDYHFENDGREIHTFRFEIDIVQSEYKSVKQLEDNQWLKDLKFNLQATTTLMVDIDNYANGNEYKRAIVI